MEFNSDLIEIQSLLRSVVKNIGDFTKIRYKGGNEMKINNVIKELEDVLVLKKYIDKRTPNKDYDKQLDDIVCFLTLNLDFKDKSLVDIKEYAHLINSIPTLSKCLLANIIVELGLNEYYCNVLHRFPVEFAEELLSEIIPCIRKSKPEICLELTYIYMKNIIKKISAIDASNSKNVEYIEKLEEISLQILLNSSGINPDMTEGWKRTRIYQHMGQTLLCLLKLLKYCQVDNEALFKTIDDLINTVCCVMNAVTVDVFCAWAELKHNNETLQTVIAEESYHIIEKYQKHVAAKPLIQMLVSIAKKPKSLNELIQEANSSTMIMKIEQSSVNRNKWFTALLNTQVFQNQEARACVKRWANLCTSEDLERLLSLSVNHKNDEEVVDIVIKCAVFFTEENLAILITRFFYQYGLKNCLQSGNTSQQLTITLNKIEKSNNKEPIKDILLLLLQDPELVLTALFKAAIKSDIVFDSLEATFKIISQIMVIENIFSKILTTILEENRIDSKNVKNYERLFKIIADASQLKLERFFLIPLINDYLKNGKYDELSYAFQIYSQIPNKQPDDVNQLIKLSVSILEKCRWKIFDFANSKARVCEQAVEILLSCKNIHSFNITDEYILSVQHVLNKYYLSHLRSPEISLDFLHTVCPHLSLENHSEAVGYLIKLLPICVQTEWSTIIKTLLNRCSNMKLIEVLTDSLMLISQVVQTQLEKQNVSVLAGLKYCVQNYGIIIKDILLPLNNEDTNVIVVKSVCRLLREIPDEIVSIEGMSLISLLPDTTLKGLTQDEDLLSILLSMNGSEVSRIIAKKMLE